jgi:radical SAM enzyme (rSAM/lipoprotein system)
MNKISLRKRLIFNVFKKLRATEISLHELTYLFWESTLRCNLNCIHCGSDCTRESEIPDMPVSDFIKVTERIKEQYVPEKVMIVITGGEPLMRSDLEQCGLQLTQQGFNWGIVTNGVLISKNRLDNLIKAGLSSITISLDGLSQSHNWLRNRDCYEKVINSIKLITQKNKLVFDIVTCVNERNFEELESLKSLLITHGVQKWRLFTISPIGRAKNNSELKISETRFEELMRFIKETRKENLIDVNYECEGFVGNYELEVRKGLYFCRAGVNIASVLIDGSISACPNIDRNFTQGNIYKNDFLDVWNNRFENMRNRDWMKNGECSDCEVFDWCSGNGMHLRDFETKKVITCQYETLKKAHNNVYSK